MRKLIFLSCAAFASLTSQAADVWVWNNGKYSKMTIDSISFSDPGNNGPIDDPINNPTDNPLFSKYEGTLALKVMGFDAGNATPTVSISEVSDGIAKVKFSEFQASGFSISDFTADKVTITANEDGSNSLSQEDFIASASLNGESSELQKCNLTGKVTADGSATIAVSFTVSNFPVSGDFKGNR